MSYNAVKRDIAPELAGYIDNLHSTLEGMGRKLTKQDVGRIIVQKLEGNGKPVFIVIIELKNNTKNKTHKLLEKSDGLMELVNI
jgi:hypothetical protein